jgi:hypothetical protein
MVRSVFGKVMWVGRATVFLVGLAVILALVFGVASVALAGVGVGAPFHLGKINTVDKVSTLVNEGKGPALSLQASSGAPLKVNSTTRVAKINADTVDGMHASTLLEPRGSGSEAATPPGCGVRTRLSPPCLSGA